jgi:hypothetical protein
MKTFVQYIMPCIIVLISFVVSYAQRTEKGEVELTSYAGEAVNVFDLREKGILEGSSYYFEEWMNMHVKFTNGKILSDYMGRYDIGTSSLEIRTESKILEIPSSIVEEFIIEKSDQSGQSIKSIQFLKLNQNPDLGGGFYEVLVKGDLSLLKGIEIDVLPPNYVTTHDAGSLNYKTVRKDAFFVSSGERADKLPNKKKKAAEMMKSYAPGSEKYILDENVNFKKQGELEALFIRLNKQGS